MIRNHLADASGFEIGDGVCLRAKDVKTGRRTLKRTSGGTDAFRSTAPSARISVAERRHGRHAVPMLKRRIHRTGRIEDLVLMETARTMKPRWQPRGCIFLQDCNRVTIRRVNARNNGDGISWQICHDVLVEHCVSKTMPVSVSIPGPVRSAPSCGSIPCAK